MIASRSIRRASLIGLGLSVVLHTGLGIVAARTLVPGAHDVVSDASSTLVELLTLPPEEPDLHLGIVESDAQTDAWLGFAEATPHAAPRSEVDQSALSTNPSGLPAPTVVVESGTVESADTPLEPVDASPSPPPPTPVSPPDQTDPEPATTPPPEGAAVEIEPTDAPEPGPAERATEPEVLAGQEPALVDLASDLLLAQVAAAPTESQVDPMVLLTGPPTMGDPEADAPEPLPPEPAPEPLPEEETPPTSPPNEAPEEVPAPQEPDPTTKPRPGDDRPETLVVAGNAGDQPGELSPSQSSPTSTSDPVEVRPGRVAAAEGLQITTVRPVFAISTMATARPRSPTVIIEFAKDGTVRRARFVAGHTTGYADVDQPLLAAIYRWTATGAPLDELSDDPEDVIQVRMKVLMR